MENAKQNVDVPERAKKLNRKKTVELKIANERLQPAYTRDNIHEKLSINGWRGEQPERWDGMS